MTERDKVIQLARYKRAYDALSLLNINNKYSDAMLRLKEEYISLYQKIEESSLMIQRVSPEELYSDYGITWYISEDIEKEYELWVENESGTPSVSFVEGGNNNRWENRILEQSM